MYVLFVINDTQWIRIISFIAHHKNSDAFDHDHPEFGLASMVFIRRFSASHIIRYTATKGKKVVGAFCWWWCFETISIIAKKKSSLGLDSSKRFRLFPHSLILLSRIATNVSPVGRMNQIEEGAEMKQIKLIKCCLTVCFVAVSRHSFIQYRITLQA